MKRTAVQYISSVRTRFGIVGKNFS
uniref:Uncharacterized protein n=1 Tax=Rhizophora mucronata TaxID=61149 RepID=A0A2P2JA23_RHIMU